MVAQDVAAQEMAAQGMAAQSVIECGEECIRGAGRCSLTAPASERIPAF